jgi:hypothetical protein
MSSDKNIQDAAKIQSEVAFYTDYLPDTPYSDVFYRRVKKIYNNDTYKTNRFREAFAGDIMPSCSLINSLWDQLYKVFNGQDAVKRFDFTSDNYKADAIDYLARFKEFWKVDLWQMYKTGYNNILIVDLPDTQETTYPEPYMYFVDISAVESITWDGNDIRSIQFVDYIDGEKVTRAYDNTSYKIINESDEIIYESDHDLDYCPAFFISDQFLNSKTKVQRKNNVVEALEKIFQYNFKSVEAFKADLLYLNPDKQAPRSSCGYETANQKCFGGKLVNQNKEPIIDNNIQKLCPNCGPNQHLSGGAGNLITIDMNNQAVRDGKINPSTDLFRYIMPEIKGVQEQYKRILQLEESISKSIAGEDTIITREAINELQQESKYQEKETVLKNLSNTLSNIITKATTAILDLRYGDRFKGCNIFLGSKFYLRTVDELQAMYNASTNQLQRNDIMMQIIELKYDNDPLRKKREILLYNLLPYSGLDDDKFIEYAKMNIIERRDIIFRTNFNSIVNEFELKYGNIIVVMEVMLKEKGAYEKIEKIKELINDIINENYMKNELSNSIPGSSNGE